MPLTASCSLNGAQQETHSCHQNVPNWPGVLVIKKKGFKLCSDYDFMVPKKGGDSLSLKELIQSFGFMLVFLFLGGRKVWKSSGNMFCIVRKLAALHLCLSSAWSGSSSHRWWTNVLLRERCTRLGSCTAQQWASFAADGLKSSHQQTRKWHTRLISSILWCNATWRVGYVFALLHFSLCLWPSTCQIILLSDLYWSEQLRHCPVNSDLISLIISTSSPDSQLEELLGSSVGFTCYTYSFGINLHPVKL